VIDGKTVWGSDTKDGGWISEDEHTYVDPSGKSVHGLVAPDGQFLPNGTSRMIDGRTVWGSVGDDGSFLSEDGTIYQTPDGRTEHGKLTDDGHFLTPKMIDGKTLWGSDTKDGGWISEDGTTYVDPKGAVQHGISAPDGTFIENGTTRTLPDGTTAYGTVLKDGGFVNYEGTTLVLPDGTELHGTLDTNTGIFTASGGGTYFISSDSGVTHGHFRPADGAFVLDGDNGVVMTPGAWRVDLKTMEGVIATITGRIKVISEACDTLGQQYGIVESAWRSPAGDTFTDVSHQVDKAMVNMGLVLDNLVAKLQQTYDNYMKTEVQAVKNLTSQA
jgi:uncharacterized protein YukE